MSLTGFLQRLRTKDSFASNIATLGSGTAFAQLITLLSAPILSRLYTPDDFGNLQYLVSFGLILATFVTLRYEMSIPLPNEDSDAYQMTRFTILVGSVGLSLISILMLINVHYSFFPDLVERFGILILLVPLIALLEIVQASMSYWFMRRKDYGSASAAKALNGSGIAGAQLLFSLSPLLKAVGLMLGQVTGQALAALIYGVRNRGQRKLQGAFDLSLSLKLAKRYRDFPLFAMWSAGLNTLGRQLPPMIMLGMYSAQEVGWYALGMRLVNMPFNVLSMSVGQVFYQHASKYVKQNIPLQPFFRKNAIKLFLLGLLPMSIVYLYGAEIFAFVLGDIWREAGLISSILAPFFLVRFTASPLSPVFALIGKQHYSLVWQIFFTLGMILIFAVFGREQDFLTTMRAYSIFSAFMFIIYIIVLDWVSGDFDRKRANEGLNERFQ